MDNITYKMYSNSWRNYIDLNKRGKSQVKRLDLKMVNSILENKLQKYLQIGNYGIEKENLRVRSDGKLSLNPHPEEFGHKVENPYIKTDFSESQVEVVTPAMDTIEEAYDFLQNLNNIVNTNIGEEYLWPQSAPCVLPKEEEIPLANFGEGERGQKETSYREFLSKKYGKKIQMISGIHYNFSFKEQFLKTLCDNCDGDDSFRDFRNRIYLKLNKKLLNYRWFLIYLTGASPFIHNTYDDKYFNKMTELEDRYMYANSLSLRNGFCGYRNEKEFIVSYDSIESYIESVEKLIADGELTDPREFYTTVRPKGRNNKKLLESLKESGINYLEIRSIDLNPLDRNGISMETFYITHLLMLYSLLTEDEPFGEKEQEMAYRNHESVVNYGLGEQIDIYDAQGVKFSIEEAGSGILDRMEEIVDIFGIGSDPKFKESIDIARKRIYDRRETIGYKVFEGIRRDGFVKFHMDHAQKYRRESEKEEYKLLGYQDLELSTQILLRDGIKRGLDFEVLDREDNFIMLSNEEKIEYVKQATKTSKDSYITIMMMENKVVTKKILERSGIRVPRGENYRSRESAVEDYEKFKDKSIVIKPKMTNFGIGITIFKDSFSLGSYIEAIDIAFEHGDTVLVEEFISGKEYRFIVIGDSVAGILNRVPANVIGNGSSTIKELVEEKNKDFLRGKGYKTPLEKINLGKAESMFLDSQGKDFDYVPLSGETVYLRENSNISTGGDSIDYTDDIIDEYKQIAIEAAKTVEARFCGVDLMIDDIKERPNDENHAIIELNFNPAIHIHCYPYIGKNRNLGEAVLKELDLI